MPIETKLKIIDDFVNNPELLKLEKRFEKFNFFDCLGINRAEIRHSNFLAWLLNPKENHKLNDYFLKEFLKQVFHYCKNNIQENFLNISEIDKWDMSNAKILREYEYIDILIIDKSNNFILVIENKIDCFQHNNQLENYKKIINEEYPDCKKYYIYLKPNFEKVEAPFIYASYKAVQKALEILIKNKKDKINNDILLAIEHYYEIIKRDIMKNDDIKEICRNIYLNHKKAIDLINQYNQEIEKEMWNSIKTYLEKENTINNFYSKIEIVFLPKTIIETDKLKFGIDKNWLSGCITGLYIENGSKLTFGINIQIPENNEVSKIKYQNLLKKLEANFGGFKKARNSEWRWKALQTSELHCNNKTSIEECIQEQIEPNIEKFINTINSLEK